MQVYGLYRSLHQAHEAVSASHIRKRQSKALSYPVQDLRRLQIDLRFPRYNVCRRPGRDVFKRYNYLEGPAD